VLDSLANLLYAVGTQRGLVSLVAVLASLYPVATVVLARTVLGERVTGAQGAGIALALGGVALIAAG
jgi:drug/metabolite transporter (DMT)-like permease